MNTLIPEDEINSILEKFEEDCGLPKWKQIQTPIWLEMNLEDIRRKTPEELSEAILEINRYALSIDRMINKLYAWKKWAISKLNDYAAQNLDKVSPTAGWGGQMLLARTAPEECKKINSFLRGLDMKIERLHKTPEGIRLIGDAIRDIKFSKIRQEKEYAKD